MDRNQRAELIGLAQVFEQRIKMGQFIIAIVAALNSKKTLTLEQIAQMNSVYGPLVMLLQTGSLETAMVQIQNLVPDGVMISAEDKAVVVELLAEKIARANDLLK